MPILEMENVSKRFRLEEGFFARYGSFINAVNNVSIKLEEGVSYGLVGESGSGKSTLAKMLAGLYGPDEGRLLINTSGRPVREFVKYIFQDPVRSLNPRMRVKTILTEGLRYSGYGGGRKQAEELAAESLVQVGLKASDLDRRPADFSGGQRQRIAIARALIHKPGLLLCDEIVSSLDVSVKSQIIRLVIELKKKFGMTLFFIAHDLATVTYISDRIGVMYAGALVEEAEAVELSKKRLHPYTELLYRSLPESRTDASAWDEALKAGRSGEGCAFYSRCPAAQEKCSKEKPKLSELSPGRKAACFFPLS